MFPIRLLIVLIAPFVIGLLLGVAIRKRGLRATLIGSAAAAVLGAGSAALLGYFYPALFSHLFSPDSWLEWTNFIPAPEYLVMFLPRSLFTMLVTLTIGVFAGSRAVLGKYSLLPLASFLLAIALTWAVNAPHGGPGTEIYTYVYRIADIDDDRDAFIQQGDEWVSFLDWNLTPYIGYESFEFRSANLMQDRMGGPVVKSGKGESVFVFVREYRKGGKTIATERITTSGFKTAAELRNILRQAVLADKLN